MDKTDDLEEDRAGKPHRPEPGDRDVPPGGAGKKEPTAEDEPTENEPPIKRHDGQVYGG